MPIFESKCNSCHNADRARGGLDLTNMNAILVGGSSGESVVSGDGENSYLYKLIARVEKPYMPQREDKMPQSEIDLIKKWIDLGLLPTANGKPIQKKKSSVNLALGNVSIGKPEGPPPMPQYLSLEPSVVTNRAFATSAMATAPWSPLVAIAGQKQVLLYNTDSLKLVGILPYPEGFIESLTFSRNGKLIVAGGGRGGKSGRVAGWEVETGERLLTMGEEYDTILTADLSADQTLLAIGSPSKLIKVYDVASNELLYEIKKHSEWITQVAFSPDGVLLATADRNGGLHIWEAQSGNPFYSLDGHKQSITDLSWRADSNILVTSSEEGAVRTWEMVNGKQVKTWNAHANGTLSAYFDPKGNIVTGGRDKKVKLWQGDGKAISTLSDFKEIVMEVCFSNDGSRVIAGDWSGKVSVWNAKDGKKIGDLSANPHDLVTLEKQATIAVSEAKHVVEMARLSLQPFTESLDQANKKLTGQKKMTDQFDQDLKEAITSRDSAKKKLELAKLNTNNKAKEQKSKENDRDLMSKEIAQIKTSLQKDNGSLAHWGKQLVNQTKQLAKAQDELSKALQKQTENPEDHNHSNEVKMQKTAMEQVQISLAQAKKENDKYQAKVVVLNEKAQSRDLSLIECSKSLAVAQQSYQNASAEQNKLNQIWQERNQNYSDKNKLATEAGSLLAQFQNTYNKAKSDSTEPKEKLFIAENNLRKCSNESARWKAELVNVDRHIELRNLRTLQSEMAELKDILREAQQVSKAALQAFENAKESLRVIPGKIAQDNQQLTQKKLTESESEKRKISVIQIRDQKQSFIVEVNKLALLAQNKSDAKESDSTFGQANQKFQETLTLLKKDLGETESQLATNNQELVDAQTAVNQAKKILESSMKSQLELPQLITTKEMSWSSAKTRESKSQNDYDLFQSKINQQIDKSKALLTKYIGLLPKTN